MALADGSWRQDVGEPVHPTLPAPHAAQDGMGFAWDAARKRFLFWPGSYYAYEAAGTPVLEYARGLWLLDPATSTWTQDLGLFGTAGTTTGSLFGGIFDDVNDELLVFGDSSGGFAVRRWHVASHTRLGDIPFTLSVPSGMAAYFTRGMHVKLDRNVYIVGYFTDGAALKQPAFWRWHLDDHQLQALAAPPVDPSLLHDLEIRLGHSHGKVVWPFMSGPDGELHGIWVYYPETDAWRVDEQVPAYGAFIGNSVTSLPDGRVAFSGGVFGRQMTHIWFYEAFP
jgi:hypothetical protein